MPTAPQRPVPQSPAPQSLAPENSAPENSALDQSPRPVQNFQVSSPPARDSSTITVHPSVYRGGYVGRPIPGLEEIFQSIVCENDYAHLSPEVSHICTTESIFQILRAMCVGVALPGSSCSLGPTFV